MKQKTHITLFTFITFLSLTGCSSNTAVSPTQNAELNSVSPTTSNKKAGFMQNSLDNWLKDDWSPAVEKDSEIQKKYMTKEVVTVKESNTTKEEVKYTESKTKGFTLQEYVDKIGAYQKAKPNDENSSHQKQMEALLVIGK